MVTDMEAGLEHLSRSTTRSSDVMLAIAEPYFKSIETAGRVAEMATELGIPRVCVVANKVRSDSELEAIDAFCRRNDLERVASIPYDEALLRASMVPCSPYDLDPGSPAVDAVSELAQTLTERA